MAPTEAVPIEHPVAAADARDGFGPGRIPYRLRIGVTGHRTLHDEDLMAQRVSQAVEEIRALIPERPATPVFLTVVSPLAKGADQLVARVVLSDGTADLDAVLPLPLAEYLKDFKDKGSGFLELYGRAATRIELPDPVPWEHDRHEARNRAYLQVGKFVVDNCDVLIALWDGTTEQGIGGTAAIVRYANKRKRPMVLINTTNGEIERLRLTIADLDEDVGLHWDALDALDEFNRASIRPALFDQHDRAVREYFLPPEAGTAVASVPFATLSQWLLPFFVRADLLADRSQKKHHFLGTPIFLLAAGAVGCAGAQAVFYPEGKRFLLAELTCIVALITVVVVGMWQRPSRRWLMYRFLAERFRSAFFLAAAGLDERSAPKRETVNVDDPSAGWVSRAYVEVWKQRPKVVPSSIDLKDLRSYLVEAWIGSQRDYHGKRSQRFGSYDTGLTQGTLGLLGVTLVFPILHLTGVGSGTRWPAWFSFASISLPALGAALTGLAEQREFELLSERYKAMNVALADEAERMAEADDVLEAIWSVAAHTEALMRQENRDWFGVMRFRDIRPHV